MFWKRNAIIFSSIDLLRREMSTRLGAWKTISSPNFQLSNRATCWQLQVTRCSTIAPFLKPAAAGSSCCRWSDTSTGLLSLMDILYQFYVLYTTKVLNVFYAFLKTRLFNFSSTIFKGIPAFERRVAQIPWSTQIIRLEAQNPNI